MPTAGFALLILLILCSLTPFPVMAMEVVFEGQHDLWTDFSLQIKTDLLTGEKTYQPKLSINQSIELYIDGQDDQNFIKGYLTNHPELSDQIYLDILLDDYTLELNRFEEAFQIPSWFNLDQNFTGLRLGYFGPKDRVSFIGMKGENILREDYIFLEPGDQAYGVSLYHAPVVLDSVQVWLDNRELHFGEDFFVIDYQLGVLGLLIPIEKASLLCVKYLQQGDGYLVFGSRYDKNFGPYLDGGILGLLAQGAGAQHGLLASEWLAQIKPWWVMELNAGLVFEEEVAVTPERELSHRLTEVDRGKILDTKLNWRLAQYFNWPGVDVAIDYQVIESNLQGLLYGGKSGKILTLDGQIDWGRLLVHHQQNYQWSLDDYLFRKDGQLEMVYFTDHWIPYLYYAYNQRNGLTTQYAIGEIAYLRELADHQGSFIYQLGIEVNTTPTGYFQSSATPYLGVKYARDEEDSLGIKVYGREGWQLAQLLIEGSWREGFFNWHGQIKYQPDYYRFEQTVILDQLPMLVNFNLIDSHYTLSDQRYLDLELHLDWSELMGGEAMIWLSLLQNQIQDQSIKTYQLGFEKALNDKIVGYGEMSVGDQERSYFAGIYAKGKSVGYDLNYTHFNGVELVDNQFLLIKKDRLAFSLGVLDSWNIYSQLERDDLDRYWTDWGVKYPISPDLEFAIQYSLAKETDYYHQLALRTTYYF